MELCIVGHQATGYVRAYTPEDAAETGCLNTYKDCLFTFKPKPENDHIIRSFADRDLEDAINDI